MGGVITLLPSKNRDHPVPDEVKAITDILCASDEKYINAWNTQYDEVAAGRSNVCRGGNMFITNGKTFKEYCSWQFNIYHEMRKRLGDKTEADINMRRYCAFMGERLLSVYIEANGLPSLGVKMRFQRWWLPYVRAVANTFHLNRESKVYIALRNKFGYNSQYNRK